MTLAEAIAQMENTNPGLNNPCALTAAPSSYCQTGTQGIMAVFCTLQDGWNACNNQIQTNVNRGLNLSTFFGGSPGVYAGYSPAAAGNDPTTYANTVAGWLGIDTTTTLSDLSSSQLYYSPSGSSGGGSSATAVSLPSIDLSSMLSGNFDLSSLFSDPIVLGIGLLGVVIAVKMFT